MNVQTVSRLPGLLRWPCVAGVGIDVRGFRERMQSCAALALAPWAGQSLLGPGQEIGLAAGPSLPYLVLKVVLALTVTAMAVFVTVRILRRFAGAQGNRELNGEVRLVGVVGLAPKKQVYLVRCFDRLLVVGASESNMTLLTEITDPEVVATVEKNGVNHRPLRLKGSFLKNLPLR